jgi:hypothetical protein
MDQHYKDLTIRHAEVLQRMLSLIGKTDLCSRDAFWRAFCLSQRIGRECLEILLAEQQK